MISLYSSNHPHCLRWSLWLIYVIILFHSLYHCRIPILLMDLLICGCCLWLIIYVWLLAGWISCISLCSPVALEVACQSHTKTSLKPSLKPSISRAHVDQDELLCSHLFLDNQVHSKRFKWQKSLGNRYKLILYLTFIAHC